LALGQGKLLVFDIFKAGRRLNYSSIWLLDLAKSLPPSTRLEGFDIASSSYPPEEWLPSNIKLALWNVFDEPPDYLYGRFDVVHIRLFLVVIDANDPSSILRHCLKILSGSFFLFDLRLCSDQTTSEPGGLLQWEEYDLHARMVETAKPDVPMDNTQKLADFVKRDIHK